MFIPGRARTRQMQDAHDEVGADVYPWPCPHQANAGRTRRGRGGCLSLAVFAYWELRDIISFILDGNATLPCFSKGVISCLSKISPF
jgi:hypothetical protein